ARPRIPQMENLAPVSRRNRNPRASMVISLMLSIRSVRAIVVGLGSIDTPDTIVFPTAIVGSQWNVRLRQSCGREVSIDRANSNHVLASEIELTALCRQFVATSEEVAKDLALLAGRIDEEPTELRTLQLAAAKEIAAAQMRLRLEADRLEGPPE